MLEIVDNKLKFNSLDCTQCGVCVAACNKNALSIERGSQTYKIKIDKNKCISCGICAKVCAANLLNKDVPEQGKLTKSKVYLSYCKDLETRRYSSSGGFCRGALIELLNSKKVDAVYSLIYSEDTDEAIGKWLYEAPNYKDIPQSLYRVVIWGDNLLKNLPKSGTVLLIGLPCQLQAAKKLIKLKSPSLICITIAILCRKTKKLGFSKYIAKNCNHPNAPLADIRYRGEGWPGDMRVNSDTKVTVPFVYHAFCWNLFACRNCYDCYHLDGDFAVGDPWEIVGRDADKIGQSMVIVHSQVGLDLINSFKTIESIPLEETRTLEYADYNFCHVKKGKNKLNYKSIYTFMKAKLGNFI